MTTKAQLREQEEAIERLHKLLQPGETVRTVLRHVARSGMTRWIDLYVINHDGTDTWLSYLAAKAGVGTWSDQRECIKIGGAGMDMGFALVYNLSQRLFPDGFECIGEGCPSNDHSNGDRNYEPHHHNSGGYALSHRWL